MVAEPPEGGRVKKLPPPVVYPCPVCEYEMSVKEFQREDGYKYECLGSEENPHEVQFYVRLVFQESEMIVIDKPDQSTSEIHPGRLIGQKAESLLERMKRLSGRED
jgi:hypothetical protein